MKKVLIVCVVLLANLCIAPSVFAQKKGNTPKTTKTNKTNTTTETKTQAVTPVNDPVLMTINGEKVTKSEFLAVFLKNNANKNAPIDQKSVNEYLDLFINFKLKVKEAEMMKLDTSMSFVNELAGYRKQLAQPYLVDKDVNESLLTEAFDRSKFDIRASHILIRVEKDASAKDSLKAYNKILDLRNRFLKGESFAKLAVEASEDPSARDQRAEGGRPGYKGNKGDLGYFSVFDMVYPFENAAFNTPVGQVSSIIRTDFGYHILYVADKKPALGKVHVAHLLVKLNENATAADTAAALAKVNEINGKIKQGGNFDDLVKQYSDDKGSAPKGGLLPWFGSNRMVPEFVSVLYTMQPDQISEPVLTMYGWHFIKLLEKSKAQTFDEAKSELKMKIARDVRSNKSKDSFIERLKAEYSYTAYQKTVDEFIPVLDTTFRVGTWKATKASNLNKPMFVLNGVKYTQTQFAAYLEKHQGDSPKEEYNAVLKNRFKSWVEEEIVSYEDTRLADKYPDFKSLLKEYRDGILLFDLTDRKVWSKAIKDSVGLQEYYDELKVNYKYPRRADAVIYKMKDEKNAKKALKIISKETAKGTAPADIVKLVNSNEQIVTFESNIYAKGDNAVLDEFEWKKGLSGVINSKDNFYILHINNVLDPSYKPLNEIKGIVISEYQNFLEKEWIRELKGKYTVVVDQEVFKSIK
jgi:peptidyl-prolyl cis-trans isomerase SurA